MDDTKDLSEYHTIIVDTNNLTTYNQIINNNNINNSKNHTNIINNNSSSNTNNVRLVAQSMPPRPHRHGVVHVLPLKPSMHCEHVVAD
jgi:hypothetical protein